MSTNPMVVKAITFWERFVLKAKRACSIASCTRFNSSKPFFRASVSADLTGIDVHRGDESGVDLQTFLNKGKIGTMRIVKAQLFT